MAEQQPPVPAGPGPPAPQTQGAPTDLFRTPLVDTDDTPTIISKNQPRPGTNDSLLAEILRGRMLAHFELLEPIGVGGMAAVLRARDTQLDRIVALKILPPEMAADPENVRRFHQEARAAAKLDHETIARVFFCGEDQGLHFIAFEYVEGENLRTTLERHGPLVVDQALHYMLQVATGLAHAVERGVVHRDIKPSNIIISPSGRAKLVDMGLARSLEPHADDGLTQSGVTLGTFDYISPEQALEPRDADARSDIYSLGCTFYHVLTGVAPVPDGTAARKLHHHQHVLPTDPRELNPAIPDEVAAILGRMMAKEPHQRYQRPEHLVEHLLRLTGRFAQGSERTDGVLYVDAPLPAPPNTRPFLVAGLSGILVVVLILLMGAPPRPSLSEGTLPGPPPPLGTSSSPTAEENIRTPAHAQGANETTPPHHGADTPGPLLARVSTRRQLADLARTLAADKEHPRDVKIVLTGDIHLDEGSEDSEPTLVLHARRLVLEGEERDGRRATLWAQYRGGDGDSWAGLILDATEEVRLNHLRIVADANECRARMAGLLIRGARKAHLLRCDFIQITWLPALFDATERLTSLAYQTGGAGGVPQLTLENCSFLGALEREKNGAPSSSSLSLRDVAEGGQDAITLSGGAVVTATGCAFGPHAALFRVRESGKKTAITLSHCTALAGEEWALVHLEEQAVAEVEAQRCFFGRPTVSNERGMAMEVPVRQAVLLRQAARGADVGSYRGGKNRYHNLDSVRLRPGDADSAPSADQFPRQLAALRGEEERVLSGSVWPWKERSPWPLMQHGLDTREARDAFTLDLKRPEAIAEALLGPNMDEVVGLFRESPWGPLYEGQLPPKGLRGSATMARKIVDPSKETGGGIYQRLEAAMVGVQQGDVISIRHNGVLKIAPVALLKTSLQVTIRAEDGYRPLLVLDDEVRDREAALFRIYDGQLTLEGLEFRLAPSQAGFRSVAVATLLGDGGVQFRQCVLTMDGPPQTLAAVTLPDREDTMTVPGAREGTGAKLGFDSCFVRGEGDLILSRTNRPFELDVRGTLVAVSGSLVNIDNTTEDTPAPTGPRIRLTFQRMTAYLGGHLLRLRCRDLRHLTPVQVERAASSLFVSAAVPEGKAALISLEGPRASDDKLREKVTWKGEQNFFSRSFAHMLDQPARESEMPAEAVSWEGWKTFASERESRSGEVVFCGPLWPAVPAAEVRRDGFRIDRGPQNVGPRVQDLPEPASEARERTTPE